MQSIQVFQYKETPMEFEIINGQVFANATLMCQHFGKTPYEFLRSSSTQRYVEALRRISEVEYIQVNNGGVNQGTWIHEKLILKLSQWLDVDFELWCDEKIAELLRTGKVEINTMPNNYLEALKLLVVKEEEKERLEMKVDNLSTALDSLVEWVSIIKVSQFNKTSEKVFNWRVLKRKSEEMGFIIKRAESPRYGFQNLYHVNAFKACYPQYNYKFLNNDSQLTVR